MRSHHVSDAIVQPAVGSRHDFTAATPFVKTQTRTRPQPNSVPAKMSVGGPMKASHEAEGHTVACETRRVMEVKHALPDAQCPSKTELASATT